MVVHRPSSFCHWQMCWPQAGKPLDQRTPRVRLSATSCSRVNRPASVGAARFDRGPGVPSRPEVTNGPFLSHKRRERQRRRAGVAEFRRERRLSLRTALTGNRWSLIYDRNGQVAGNRGLYPTWAMAEVGHRRAVLLLRNTSNAKGGR